MELRGLNKSFLDSLQKAVDEDPFADLSSMLKSYMTLRSKVDSEFDQSISKPTAAAGTSTKSGFTFGNPTPPSNTSGFSFGGTTPSNNAFTFGAKPAGSEPKHSDSEKASDAIEATEPKPTMKPVWDWKPSLAASPLTPGFSTFTATKSGVSNGSQSPSPFSGLSNKGSIGNPVGFGFGSQPSTPKTEPSTPSLSGQPSGEADASADKIVKSAASTDSALTTKASQDADQSTVSELVNESADKPKDGINLFDEDGPGEEDETTAFKIKTKAYKMAPQGDKLGWVVQGTGKSTVSS